MCEVLSVPWGKQGSHGLCCVWEGKELKFPREEHPHTKWTPAESKTGQDSSGLIRQRTHELKSGEGNMTFFSILSIRTALTCFWNYSERSWSDNGLPEKRFTLVISSPCKGILALKIQNAFTTFWEIWVTGELHHYNRLFASASIPIFLLCRSSHSSANHSILDEYWIYKAHCA